MACYHPLIGVRYPAFQKRLKIIGAKSRLTNESDLLRVTPGKEVLEIPCSRCIGCRLERSRQWAVRCINEAQMHHENCFITLTYSEDQVPCGELAYTLWPRHLTNFWKRLRKAHGNNIKYFACGEYGDITHRPHYHACVFGFDFKDKKPYKMENDIPLYRSDSLDSLWTHGGCTIGDVNFDTAAYTARYIMDKKLGKESEHYHKNGIVPEFVRMSRRPGIGAKFFEKFESDIFPHDYLVIRDGIKCRPPKYYTEKYGLTNPEEYLIIKESRKKEAQKNFAENTTKRLKVKEKVKCAQIKSLKRTLE